VSVCPVLCHVNYSPRPTMRSSSTAIVLGNGRHELIIRNRYCVVWILGSIGTHRYRFSEDRWVETYVGRVGTSCTKDSIVYSWHLPSSMRGHNHCRATGALPVHDAAVTLQQRHMSIRSNVTSCDFISTEQPVSTVVTYCRFTLGCHVEWIYTAF